MNLRHGLLTTTSGWAMCVLLLSFDPSAAWADECSPILIPTTHVEIHSRDQEYALLSLIHSQEDLEHARSASGGYLGQFKLDVSYNDFDKHRTEYINSLSVQLNDKQADQIATSFLPESVTSAWLQCELKLQPGVKLAIGSLDSEVAVIRVAWSPPRNTPISPSPPVLMIYGSPDAPSQFIGPAKPLKPTFDAVARDARLTIRRMPGKTMVVTLQISGFADDIRIPPYKPPPEPPQIDGAVVKLGSNSNSSCKVTTVGAEVDVHVKAAPPYRLMLSTTSGSYPHSAALPSKATVIHGGVQLVSGTGHPAVAAMSVSVVDAAGTEAAALVTGSEFANMSGCENSEHSYQDLVVNQR